MSYYFSKETNYNGIFPNFQGTSSTNTFIQSERQQQYDPYQANIKQEPVEFNQSHLDSNSEDELDYYHSNVKLENDDSDYDFSNAKFEYNDSDDDYYDVKLEQDFSNIKLEDEFVYSPYNVKFENTGFKPDHYRINRDNIKSELCYPQSKGPVECKKRKCSKKIVCDCIRKKKLRRALRSEMVAIRTVKGKRTVDEITQASRNLRSLMTDPIDLEVLAFLEKREYEIFRRRLAKYIKQTRTRLMLPTEDDCMPSRQHGKTKNKKKKDQCMPKTIKRSTKPTQVAASVPPIDRSNIGHRMLLGMGWNEGGALGSSNDGITEPVQVTVKKGRKGLGF